MKSVQLVDNKGIAAKIATNTPDFSIHKNATARKMQTTEKQKNKTEEKGFIHAPKLAFKQFSLYPTHSIWLVGSEFFCF